VEVVAGKSGEERLLLQDTWRIPAGIEQGAPLRLEYLFDENQVFSMNMYLAGKEGIAPFEATIENPLTNVVNPIQEKLEIEELEEQLRTGQIPKDRVIDTIISLAEKYANLGQRERAVEYLKRSLRARNRPDAGILNQMAIYYGELGDHEREEKFYREAALASSWSGPWFNLALTLRRRRRLQEAMEAIDEAIKRDPSPPYLVLKALIEEERGNQQESDRCLKKAWSSFGPPPTLDNWELGWFLTAAKMKGDEKKASEAEMERRRRHTSKTGRVEEGELPMIKPGLQKV